MTERRIAALMSDTSWNKTVQKLSRRYTRIIEEQEEYSQEALLRVADRCKDNDEWSIILDEARRAIKAAYDRKRYHVRKHNASNPNGYIEGTCKKRIAVKDLGHARYLTVKPLKITPWYYAPEWVEYGLRKDSIRPIEYQLIIVG
ncbi:MAG: hypothetical protein ACOYB0_10660 [Polynucleobacter sp.]